MASRLDRFRSAIGLVIAAALGTTALLDPAVAWFAIPAAIGGLLTAGVIFAAHRSRHLEHLEEATDAADSLTLGMFNLSTVNPAGIGGLGLIVMAAVIAAQYREIQYVLALGAIGGTTMAAWLIHHRRVQAPTPARLQLLKTRR